MSPRVTFLYNITVMVLIEQKLQAWTQDKSAIEARVNVYREIRDIPYAIVPELNDAARYAGILNLRRGSCTPKHFLLADMYRRLGMLVLYAVYPFRWDEVWDNIDRAYPDRLRKLSAELPTSHHLACRVDIEGKFVLVDATLDPALERAGLPVNHEWDGFHDTILPVKPCGEEQIYHPSEAYLMLAQYSELQLAFYHELNAWLEAVRQS